MNPRERLLALSVLVVVVLAGTAFLFHRLFWIPLEDRTASIVSLQQDVDKKKERIRQVLAEKPRLERWQQLSLPADVNLSLREYERYLSELVRQSGIPTGALNVTPRQPDSKSSPAIAGKGPIYTKLDFSVAGRTSLAHLVDLLERFYRTGLLQQVKNLSISRPLTRGPQQEQGDLNVTLTVEALILSGAENRPDLLPGVNRRLLAVDVLNALRGGPTGLALVPWVAGPTGPLGPARLARPPRQYAAITNKNIFLGNQRTAVVQEKDPLDPTRFVHLIDITHGGQRTEALLYDRYNNRYIRLRNETGSGYDTFRIDDDRGEPAVRGKVMLIQQRDLIFRVDDNYYTLHVDQNLEEALRNPLTAEQVKALGLAAAVDKGPSMP